MKSKRKKVILKKLIDCIYDTGCSHIDDYCEAPTPALEILSILTNLMIEFETRRTRVKTVCKDCCRQKSRK